MGGERQRGEEERGKERKKGRKGKGYQGVHRALTMSAVRSCWGASKAPPILQWRMKHRWHGDAQLPARSRKQQEVSQPSGPAVGEKWMMGRWGRRGKTSGAEPRVLSLLVMVIAGNIS